MKTWHKLTALLVAVAAVACWWGQRGQREDLDRLRGEVRSVAQSIDATDRAVARTAVAQRIAAAAEPRAAPPAPGGAPSEPPAPPPAAPAEPTRPTIDPPTLRAHLSSQFDAQRPDATWSATARQTLHTKLAALVPQAGALRSVECKETLCRIEMVYDDVTQYQAFLHKVTPEALPWNGSLFSSLVGDPTDRPVTFVAFLSREGHELAVD